MALQQEIGLAILLSCALGATGSCAGAFANNNGVRVTESKLSQMGAATVLPELPRVLLDTTYTPPQGRTINVVAGGDLQAAIDSAQRGDTIALQSGATFIGNFTLPAKTGEGWIVIRSDTSDSQLPQPGDRITLLYANALAKILSPNAGAAIETANNAHHYRLLGLEIGLTNGVEFNYGIVKLGDGDIAQGIPDLTPSDLILDRCYIHGNPTGDVSRGVALNSARTAIIDSFISDIHGEGFDTQAICGWNGPGPFKIVNNYLEGAGENFMLGGGDPATPGLIPSDIEFRRNHIYKPLRWRAGDPSYAGRHWSVKNLLEMKNAQRLLIDGNVFENNWGDAQDGFAVVLKSANQDGSAPWSVTRDVTFTNNVVRHSASGINLQGRDPHNPSAQAQRFLIRNNLWEDIDGQVWNGEGRFFQINETSDVTVDHNTVIHTGDVITTYGVASPNFVYTNNLSAHNAYGVKGDGTNSGSETISQYFPGAVFSKNVLAGGSSASYPANNFFPTFLNEVGFASRADGIYRLAATSPFRNAGTDGKDLGCDFDALNLAATKLDQTDNPNQIRVAISDPVACTDAGDKLNGVATSQNTTAVAVNASVRLTTSMGLVTIPVMCLANVGTCTVTNATAINWTGTLAAGQTATITYMAQVADNAVAGQKLTVSGSASFNGGLPVTDSASITVNCPPVGPGIAITANRDNTVSDQNPGSVLIYNIYTSSTNSNQQNTRISLTNTHPMVTANIHLFFVADSCVVADSYLCLTPNQTTSFLASDLDPGTTGYLVAVATDGRGCPIDFNYLIGDEYVKFASGHAANLGALAIAALAGGLPACDENLITATLAFDGVSYGRVPATLALSNIGSKTDGNDTMLIINRIGGNLTTGAATLGTIFGQMYDSAENAVSFTLTGGCQFRNSISNNFPRITPRFEQFITAATTGWMKLYSQTGNVGMAGAAINFNPNASVSASAFNQGHNLHVLTLNDEMTYVIPVFPPACQ